MASSKLDSSTLSTLVDTVQQSPPKRTANQSGENNGTSFISSPSAKQNKHKERDPNKKTNKKRKKRTLKDLVRICEELGDKSDKSELLARWKNYRMDPNWKALTDAHIEPTIHHLVIKLENLLRDFQTEGGASGKVRDVIRERYWEASPLTIPENTLKEEILVPQWTRLQVESWALYLESQIVFAGLGLRICQVIGKFSDREFTVIAETDCLVDHCYHSDDDDFDHSDDFELASDISNSDSGYSEDLANDTCVVGFNLSAHETIPVFRFALRTRLELNRMSKVQRGAARAFQLALTFRLGVLEFSDMCSTWRQAGVEETDALLLDLLSQEQNDPYPEHPLDCAHAFLYLSSHIASENNANVVGQLGAVIDKILPLVIRDLRREYRRNLILAFGKRLPAEIYEYILDWVEVVHDLPNSRREYTKRLPVLPNPLVDYQGSQ